MITALVVCVLPPFGVKLTVSITRRVLVLLRSFRPAGVGRSVIVPGPAVLNVLEPLAIKSGLGLCRVAVWAVVLRHWMARRPGYGAVKRAV